MATTIRKLPQRGSATLQLHIELRGTKPKVWRRVLVPETITLAKLHLVIQAAFGWTDGHLHEFDVGGERIGQPDPDYDTFGEIRDERKVRLLSVLRENEVASLDYIYCWRRLNSEPPCRTKFEPGLDAVRRTSVCG